MLVTDPTTGYLHEVPGYAGWGGWGGYPAPPEVGWYGGSGLGATDPYGAGYGEGHYQVAYDGFGNPVGAFPALAALAPLAAKFLPMALPALPGLLKSLLGNPQFGYAPSAGYAGAAGLGYYGEPEGFDGYYAEPYVDPAMGYCGYSEPGVPQQVAFDRFGNPVGAFPALAALAPLAAKILPSVLPALPGLLRSLFGRKRGKGLGLAAPGLAGYGEANFDGYGYYPAPGHSLGYAPGWEGALAEYGSGYGQVVYDGFGNPVGSIPALASLASRFIPAITRAIPKAAGLIRRVLPQARRVVQTLAPVARQVVQSFPTPAVPVTPSPMDMSPDSGEPMLAPLVPGVVGPVTPVTPLMPVAPAPVPVPVPYPVPVRVPGAPRNVAYFRQFLPGNGGGPRRRRRARPRRRA